MLPPIWSLGKLLPKKAALSIPFYASLSETISTPEYDPYDLDITLKQKIKPGTKKQTGFNKKKCY